MLERPRVGASSARGFLLAALVMWSTLSGAAGRAATAGRVLSWPYLTYSAETNVIAMADVVLLADGTVPTAAGTLSNVVAVASGGLRTLALKEDGTVLSFGRTSYVPEGLSNVVAIAVRDLESRQAITAFAVRTDGTLAGWSDSGPLQEVLAGRSNFVAISVGSYYGLALKSDGTVVAWDIEYDADAYVSVPLTNVIAVAAGRYHGLALKSDGTVMAWLWKNIGFPDCDFGQATVPDGLSNVVAIVAGTFNSLALLANGTLVAWGRNEGGEWAIPEGLSRVVAIAINQWGYCALITAWPPTIVRQPSDVSISAGEDVVLTLEVQDATSIQWYRDGAVIPGATNAELTIASARGPDSGSYTAVVTNEVAILTSRAARVRVVEWPCWAEWTQRTNSFRLGGTLALGVEIHGLKPYQIQWQINNEPIPGATNTDLIIRDATVTNTGFYSVIVTNLFTASTNAPVWIRLAVESESGAEGPLIYFPTRKYIPGDMVQQTTWFSSTHYAVWKSGCSDVELRLDTNTMIFSGEQWCGTASEDYYFFGFGWYPGPVSGSGTTTTISEPAPEWLNGQWKLKIEVVPEGGGFRGDAWVTLDNGAVKQFLINVTNDATTGSTILRLDGYDEGLKIYATWPEMKLLAVYGRLEGQTIATGRALPISLRVNGGGSIGTMTNFGGGSGWITNGRVLLLGSDYQLTAVSKKGSVFSHWSLRGQDVTSTELTFTMSSNLVITANFVPGTDAFTAAQGVYNGLFYNHYTSAQDYSGLFTLRLNADGNGVGKLAFAGRTYPFKTRLTTLTGEGEVHIPRVPHPRISSTFTIDPQTQQISGTVGDQRWLPLPLDGSRIMATTNANLADCIGTYEARFLTPDLTHCYTNGHATITIDGKGRARFIGTLGDGARVRCTTAVSQDGRLPIYAVPHGRRGLLIGWLAFTNQPATTLEGKLTWIRKSRRDGPPPCADNFSVPVYVSSQPRISSGPE